MLLNKIYRHQMEVNMLKGISISLVSLSLVVGFQVHADIANTLNTIDFKDICKGEGGSPELGGEVLGQVGPLVFELEQALSKVRNELNKDKAKRENPAIKKLIENLNADIKVFNNINPHGRYSEACLLQKDIKYKK